MRLLFLVFIFLVNALFIMPSAMAVSKNMQAVQIYTDNILLDLIKDNKHLSQVVLDECQLVQDIEARANKAKMPSYQFLWGDMLAYGVCVEKDIPLGLHYMHLAADQGLAEGLEQLGRYYHIGKFMQVDIERAIVYLKTAASLNNLAAQMRLAGLYQQDFGSPLDYPALYSQLHHSLTDDKATHKKISELLAVLASKMPDKVVAQAKRTSYTN
ncbi:flagellar protein MotX [Colwellia sp. MT41]|uniref:Sodium-type polar flagellar protein MotX n=1 Tax=Colwellia marinimaniae TaxID=1513592 RepID=A0ABQ0MXE7_9GAMM|nr:MULTISPECIES: SEL1-like repeat protein [Colwellia]ALO36107.1 flagellar protein MotX [Colwellia sp. MT41]GAW97043.1 sodium-type polar flagellar protein MotX [Colwellia marinimaniae]